MEQRNKGHEVRPFGCHDERFAGSDKLGELQNVVDAPLVMAFGGCCLL